MNYVIVYMPTKQSLSWYMGCGGGRVYNRVHVHMYMNGVSRHSYSRHATERLHAHIRGRMDIIRSPTDLQPRRRHMHASARIWSYP